MENKEVWGYNEIWPYGKTIMDTWRAQHQDGGFMKVEDVPDLTKQEILALIAYNIRCSIQSDAAWEGMRRTTETLNSLRENGIY